MEGHSCMILSLTFLFNFSFYSSLNIQYTLLMPTHYATKVSTQLRNITLPFSNTLHRDDNIKCLGCMICTMHAPSRFHRPVYSSAVWSSPACINSMRGSVFMLRAMRTHLIQFLYQLLNFI